ncbi:MAG: hypothetical protein COV44_08760 [Deltaproteobacteria bacterium CG11_big_fil_rev_8_21_14_0_20_45_16]|nr:MAG: hypothetical protein COV44_08760 [Deltaproteobacteria bacterium CG11_big_fil_rev_8_21_14_0_20_45_16]
MLVFKKIPEELDAFEAEIVIAVVGRDEKPLRSTNAWLDWRLYGTLTEVIVRGVFHAELGEKCMIPTYGRFGFDRIIMLGADNLFDEEGVPNTEEGRERWQKVLRSLDETIRSLKVSKVGLSLPRYEAAEQERLLLKIVREAQLPEKTSLFLSRASSFATPLGV